MSRERSLQHHYGQLNKVQTRTDRFSKNEICDKVQHLKSPSPRLKKLQDSIEYENDLLVDRLLKIWRTPRKLNNSNSGPRTLNARNRKIQNERIMEENKRMAQKLQSATPVVSKSLQNIFYKKHNLFKRRLSKATQFKEDVKRIQVITRSRFPAIDQSVLATDRSALAPDRSKLDRSGLATDRSI